MHAPEWLGLRLAFFILIGTMALGINQAHAGDAMHYTGIARAADGGPVRYREEHWLYREQSTPMRLVLYRCPDGAPFARKILRYTTRPWTPEFIFEDARDGIYEEVRPEAGGWKVLMRAQANEPVQTAQLGSRDDAVIDAGFDAFVQGHWQQLIRPEGMQAAFLMPSRLDYLKLQLKPLDVTSSGLQVFRLSLTGWMGVIAPTIDMSYERNTHRLAQFVGVSDIRDDRGHRQRVRIDFSADAITPSVNQADVEAAMHTPLTSQCTSPEPASN
jgi:hypothetical protein